MRATDKLRASAPAGAPFSKPSAMMIFVVEIMGRSIAAFNAESKIAGDAFIGEESSEGRASLLFHRPLVGSGRSKGRGGVEHDVVF